MQVKIKQYSKNKRYCIVRFPVISRQGFPEELGENRKRHEAVDIALNRKITSDIMRQNRRPGAILGVDAASCYDRIVHSIVILIARQ